jgi:hypothetical protein
LLFSVLAYYGVLAASRASQLACDLQIVSLVPLWGITLSFYRISQSNALHALFHSKWIGFVMKVVSLLTLEIYIVQSVLIPLFESLTFPLGFLLATPSIVLAAYGLKICANIFSQTFNDAPYDWKGVFRLWESQGVQKC